ncbi:MAG: multidrug ABC transporter permease [alpha proteobacterium MED-G10]|nr:MAG: multidrug ABC transporter permease [alpha proteobacterium MED-G10]|tara:strand:- start:8126 stop:8914 length:789 start_codon:yes stop_codon:yes gene_type:complete
MNKVKSFKGFNWIGFYTLYSKEVRRFLNVFAQTVLAPAITTLLFYIIFTISVDRSYLSTESFTFSQFLAPGLVCMSIMQNAFANTSSSILISKVQGNIVDVLMPPLSEYELTFSYSLGGVTRGLLVGLSVSIVIYLIVPIQITNLFIIIYFALFSSLLLSLLGILCGIWAKKFDHMASVTNFIILPLTFLSGTFYSIERLPEDWRFFAYLNPFFYIIDGFRYGFVGVSDSNISLGIFILAMANLIFLILTIYIFKKGYGLRN